MATEYKLSYTGAEINEKLGKVSQLETEIADLDVQSDWNQNDSTAKDYVKNRPFWTDDPVEAVLLEEITNEWTDLSFNGALLLDPIEIEEGATYKVNWDGTLYECVAYVAEAVGAPSIGNAVTAQAGSVSNNEPFFVTVFNGFTMVFADSIGNHTFKLVGIKEEVHKIDEKYLPDIMSKKPIDSDYLGFLFFLDDVSLHADFNDYSFFKDIEDVQVTVPITPLQWNRVREVFSAAHRRRLLMCWLNGDGQIVLLNVVANERVNEVSWSGGSYFVSFVYDEEAGTITKICEY